MIRAITAACALVLFVVPPLTAPIPAVIVGGALGLVLTVAGLVVPWRWPVTCAACVFLTDYAAALWLAGAAVSVLPATGVGLAVLGLVHSAELARCGRGAAVDRSLARSQLTGGLVFVGVTLGAGVVLVTLARSVAAAIPYVGAPVLAAAGALGVVLALVVALTTDPYGRSAGRRDRTAR
jgi:hypothetical protein